MSLDSDLRDMLTEQADRLDGPVPDIVAIRAGGLRMRRRRRSAVVASSGLAVLLSLGVGLGIAAGQRDNAAGDLPVGQPSRASTSTEVPWCVPDPSGGQRILGEGAPIRTLCHEIHEGRLWHHAGTTVLVRSGTVQRVADGRLTPLGNGDGNVSMSHDGRLAAWSCGRHPLEVYEVATATKVATTDVDAVYCGRVAGIDDLGRVYVTVDDQTGVLDVRMYDIRRREWSQVVGLPVDGGTVTYVTADGFAVESEKVVVTAPGYGDTLPVASVEGRIDDAGRFVPQREVPIGRGRWSPDRSLVVDQQAEGVVVHSADLTTRVVLDLPTASFTRTADRLPGSDFLWESPTAVLAVGDIARGSRVYRCDVRSGTCELVDRPGWPPFGNNALVGG